MNYPSFIFPEQNPNELHRLRLNELPLEPAFDKREARRTVSKLFLAAAVFLLISTAVVFIAEFALIFLFGIDGASELLANPYVLFGLQILSMYVIAFPIFLIMTKGLTRKSDFDYISRSHYDYCGYYSRIEEKSSRDGMSFGEFVALFFVSTTVMVFGGIISEMFTSFLSGFLGHTVENATSDLIYETPLGLVILVVVVIGPIVEEIMFRKVFIDVLGVYGDRLAIVVSAFAFGFFHGNFSQLLYATLLGLILGYIYTKTRRIGLSILMHMLVNFFGTVPSLLVSDSIDRLASAEEMTEAESLTYLADIFNVYGLVILQYGFAIVGLIIFIVCTAKRLYSVPDECELRIPAKNVPRITFFNKGVLFFYLLCVLQIMLSLL